MFNSRTRDNSILDLVYLVPAALFFLVAYLWKGSLASWDEAIYAEVAKQVVLSGDWLHLSWAGAPWVDKPPLAIWATALIYKLFGISEWTARLFSALCGVGTVILTYFIGRNLISRWAGFLAAGVLLSSLHFIRFSRFGMMDAPVTFFLTLSLYFFWLGRERNRYLIFSGLAFGLAFMTKSFAAFFILPITWLYAWWAGEQDILKRSTYWVGIILAVLIALPWNLFQMLSSQPGFIQESLLKHFVLRTTQVVEGHAGSYYFYIRTLVNKYHPWILIGIFSAPWFLFKAIKDRSGEIVFLASWMFSVFGIVTLMKTKIPWYIFPVYPALSLSVAYVLAKWVNERYKTFMKVLFIVVLSLHVWYGRIFNQDYSRTIKGIAPSLEQRVPKDSIVYLYNYHGQPEGIFYLNRAVSYVDDENALAAAVKKNKGFYCLVFEKELKRFESRLPELGLSVEGSFENLRFITDQGKHP